jgi:branched-chain amino acid transport system permease protein
MLKRVDRNTLVFVAGAALVIVLVQVLINIDVLNSFWLTIIRIGGVMGIACLGLNLIYGFNGQFSLGQWGFFAIGAYAAADVTYRWVNDHSASGLVVLSLGVLLTGVAFLLMGRMLARIRGLDPLSAFSLYLIAAVAVGFLSVFIGQILIGPVTSLLSLLPAGIAVQVVFFFSIIMAGLLAAEVSFLIGLPVLTLGSDYFGIATLAITVIVKVLLDNSDTLFGFVEMKGARGMIGIPKIGSWLWVSIFLLATIIVVRNLLQSSYGRAIVSIREDEIAAKAMGIDVANFKTLSFVLGSLMAGVAGAIYAHINGFLHPDTFNFIKSFDILIIVVFGGLGSITGTVAAAFTWALVLEGFLRLWLPEGFETWRFVVYPILLLLMMLLRPKGLFGGYELPFLRHSMPALSLKPATAAITPEAVPAPAPAEASSESTPGISLSREDPQSSSEG